MKVTIVFNPIAGGGKQQFLQRVVNRLSAGGHEVVMRATTRAGDAEEYAYEHDDERHGVLAVAGGDGTINEAANGLMKSGGGRFAIIPLGTANVLAREIGLKITPEAVADTIVGGRERTIYPGLANGRGFLLMSGFGFDAYVVEGVNSRLKSLIGKGAYVWGTLSGLFSFPFPAYQVQLDGAEHAVASGLAMKARHYAGPYIAAPQADMGKDSFEVVLFQKRGPLAALRYATALLRGRLHRQPDVLIAEGRSLVVSGPDGREGSLQADGDFIGALPVEITISRVPLQLLTPANSAYNTTAP